MLVHHSTDIPCTQLKCRYCGMGELEVCSPLVFTQSRAEHDAAVDAAKVTSVLANGVIGAQIETTVRFLLDGAEMPAGGLGFPFLPAVDSPQGAKLNAAALSNRDSLVVAHEICALQMFQARVNRAR